MNLVFRGIPYNYQLTVNSGIGLLSNGIYRGQKLTYTMTQLAPNPSQGVNNLVYRGISSLSLNQPIQPLNSNPIASQPQKPQLMGSQTHQTHQLNILKRLDHRIESAKAKGDEVLIKRLEAEKQKAA